MKYILLAFLNDVDDVDKCNQIINEFDSNNYKIYLYENITYANFHFNELTEIIRYYKEVADGVNKIVILSNIRDLLFFWYRCYNQVVDDFIYLVEESEKTYFDLNDKYYSMYYNIFEFNGIEQETIEGKIYLTKYNSLILPLYFNNKYFIDYNTFDFKNKSYKGSINKKYENEDFSFDFNYLSTDSNELIKLDKINQNILFMKGQSQYDVLRIASDYYIGFYEKLGFNVDVLDFLIANNEDCINKIIIRKNKFITSFNCIGIDLELNNGMSIFDVADTPFLGCLGDHPSYHAERIKKSPKKILFSCIDEENLYYFQKRFPDKKITLNTAVGYKSKNYEFKEYRERKIDFLFAGTLVNPDDIKKAWNTSEKKYIEILTDITNLLILNKKNININLELDRYVHSEVINSETKSLLYRYIEYFIRFFKRYELIKKLGESGLTVMCIGNIDIYNKLNKSNKFIIKNNVSYQELLDTFNNTKIVINMTGHLNYGMTERIASAMINGAAVITEKDEFTQDYFIEDENIIFYDFNQMDDMIDKIKLYLANEEKLEEIARKGQEYASKMFDFRNEIVRTPRLMRQFDESFNS